MGKKLTRKFQVKPQFFSYIGPGQYEDIFGFSKIESQMQKFKKNKKYYHQMGV